jgi:myo-inositol 2-dehydrogenase / D-chiro-inositol 1-dehydrogenase
MNDCSRANRRDFLKGSTMAAAGVALAGGLNFARTAHAASSDQLKIALIGCGGRGTGAVDNALTAVPNIKLIAVADAFADSAKNCVANLKKKHGDKIDVPAERVFAGLDAYEKAIAAGPDVVFLATPPGFRPIHYAAAIKAGKHVFMEKPCCVDAAGFRSLQETNKLADEKNLKVVVGLQRHYQPSYMEGIKKIHDGEIGDLILSQAYWNGGGIWFRNRNPQQTELEYQTRNWYHFVWACGDNICEQHVHNLDVCNWAKGDHPVEANGMGGCLQRYTHADLKKGSGQIFDEHFVEFTYKDGTKLYSQCRQIPHTWSSVSEHFFGTKGQSNGQAKAKTGGNPYELEHVALFKAIRENEKHNDGWYGATSSFTAVLGRMATYSGNIVKWDEAVAKGPSILPQQFAFDAPAPVQPDAEGRYPIALPGVYKPFDTKF